MSPRASDRQGRCDGRSRLGGSTQPPAGKPPGRSPSVRNSRRSGQYRGLAQPSPPLIVPAVVVFLCNTLGGSEAFAYVRAAIVGLKDRSLQLTVELFVVEVQFHRCAS